MTKQGIQESEIAFKKSGVSIISRDEAKNISEGAFLPKEWVRKVALGRE
uniref:Uncharacterized protein n=1 Tax=Caenorhabditis japonica TaxID=281687 RepID=A0A8R1IJV1_CAEJA